MKSLRPLLLAAGVAAVAACVPRQEPAPKRPQPPVQRPAQQIPQPQPQPAPAQDWRDVPLTPGAWYYRNEGASSQALFGVPNSEGVFIVRCNPAARQVTLSREGNGNAMTVRTTSTSRTLPVSVQTEPLAYVMSMLPATDRLLDAIAFSRGRFTVEVPGTSMLVLPAWPEVARVVEDCRG